VDRGRVNVIAVLTSPHRLGRVVSKSILRGGRYAENRDNSVEGFELLWRAEDRNRRRSLTLMIEAAD